MGRRGRTRRGVVGGLNILPLLYLQLLPFLLLGPYLFLAALFVFSASHCLFPGVFLHHPFADYLFLMPVASCSSRSSSPNLIKSFTEGCCIAFWSHLGCCQEHIWNMVLYKLKLLQLTDMIECLTFDDFSSLLHKIKHFHLLLAVLL